MSTEFKKRLNLKPHKNIADSIPIRSIAADGVMEVGPGKFSKTYSVSDINYSIAKMEERASIYTKWSSVLKSVDPSYSFQLLIDNHQVDIDYLSDRILLAEAGDHLDELREDINNVIKKNLEEGNNAIRREIYITLTIPANDLQDASKKFINAETDLISILRSIPGCSARPLNALKRLNLIHDIFAGGDEKELEEYGYYNREKVKNFSLENLYRTGVTAVELVQPESIEYRGKYFILGSKYGRAFNLERLPVVVSDNFLKELSTMPFNILYTMNIDQVDSASAHNLVKTMRTGAAAAMSEASIKAAERGYSVELTNPDLRTNLQEADDLLIDLERRDQKLFDTRTHVVIFGNTKEELDTNCNKFVTTCRTKNVRFDVADGLQENTLISAMPFGIDMTPRSRTLTTESLAAFVPFSTQELNQKGGIVYGVNKVSHNILTYDRFSGTNYNELVFGSSGSGKSFFVKKSIINTFLHGKNDADVVIIDPQGEYTAITKALGGQEIHLKGAGEDHINPLEISVEYGTNPVADKSTFLVSMCEEMLHTPVTAIQKTAISLSAKRVYEKWRLTQDKDSIPTLEDFYNVLEDYYEGDGNHPEIFDLLKTIEFYAGAGTDTLFCGQSNVDTNSSFVCWNIQHLAEPIRPLAMLIVLDNIFNRMAKNRSLGRPTYIFIDECHLLFQHQQTAQFMQKEYKLARKEKGAICSITQEPEDVLRSAEGRTLINNTSFVVLLKQSSLNSAILAEQLHLSARQLEYVTDSLPGEGLLCVQPSSKSVGGIIPFEDPYPEDSLLYQLCQTSSMGQE